MEKLTRLTLGVLKAATTEQLQEARNRGVFDRVWVRLIGEELTSRGADLVQGRPASSQSLRRPTAEQRHDQEEIIVHGKGCGDGW